MVRNSPKVPKIEILNKICSIFSGVSPEKMANLAGHLPERYYLLRQSLLYQGSTDEHGSVQTPKFKTSE